MTLLTLSTTFIVLMVLAAAVLGWVADLRRGGRATSAWESRAQAERPGAFRTADDRANEMRERIRRERIRRERARAAAGRAHTARGPAGDGSSPAGPPPPGAGDRPNVPPPAAPEARHRAALGLGPEPITPEALRRQYLQLVAAYHPDRVAGLGVKLQRLAEEETKSINEAYAFFKRRLDL